MKPPVGSLPCRIGRSADHRGGDDVDHANEYAAEVCSRARVRIQLGTDRQEVVGVGADATPPDGPAVRG